MAAIRRVARQMLSPIRLADYRPPPLLVPHTALCVRLGEHETLVDASLGIERRDDGDLVLDGEGLELRSIRLGGEELAPDEYLHKDGKLRIYAGVLGGKRRLRLDTSVAINPRANSELSGLYMSGDNWCSQCEAEGFRRITFYPDRPDVLSRFRTTIIADEGCPVLLGNGNLLDEYCADGLRTAIWDDPHPKPCYLFALVAGHLGRIEDSFTTASGRKVALRIYASSAQLPLCQYAMQALKQAMAWDEQHYGREYDLDLFMVVAVDDFNMGAMENKGLNIFNSSLLLADRHSATDQRHRQIAATVAHEYFHNWSGNRVTCRDWFQLSLKEGFTVFRESQFAEALAPATARIEAVQLLREHQFAEDGGPLAHPVRPHSYNAIDNFYTATVYEKGAELVRMLHLMLGPRAFRRACDSYFERNDGRAATIEDFIAAMDGQGADLQGFMRWYEHAGTPQLFVRSEHDRATGTYLIKMRQRCAGGPRPVPVRLGLLDRRGQPLPLHSAGLGLDGQDEALLVLRKEREQFVFEGLAEPPVPSLLRSLSAPVRLHYDWQPEQLQCLWLHDGDPLNRWDAGQMLATDLIMRGARGAGGGDERGLLDGLAALLDESGLDDGLRAMLLELPGERGLAAMEDAPPLDALLAARQGLEQRAAAQLAERFAACFGRCQSRTPYRLDAPSQGRRALRICTLQWWMASGAEDAIAACVQLYGDADNLTERNGALRLLADSERAGPKAAAALDDYHRRHGDDALMLDNWLRIQAAARPPGALQRVQRLMERFGSDNPNRVRALVGGFAANVRHFHAADGSGYDWLARRVMELDATNPQLAARILEPLSLWRLRDAPRAALMRGAIERIAAAARSKNVLEQASRALDCDHNPTT